MPQLTIEKLTKSHKRKEFDCGIEELNDYLQRFARQQGKKNYGKTYVLTNSDKDILGYYSISTTSIEPNLLPESYNLPKFQLPAALIGRLAVDKKQKGKKYGTYLLMDALNKILQFSTSIGIYCITVDAKDDAAKSFYKKFGFEELTDDDKHLYISVKKVENSIRGS